jgi:hypothetical protein
LLKATNRLEEAEPLMRRAVDILERSLGPDHPWTRTGRTNLEILLAEIGAAAPCGNDVQMASEASGKRPARRRRSQGEGSSA